MSKVTAHGLEIEFLAGATVLQTCALAGKGLIKHFRPRSERRNDELNAQLAEAAQ